MEDCDGTGPSAKPIDIVRHLPLCLAKSEIIPPAPNRSKSSSEFEPAIDWLSDFAGYSWIAYGASSLLVIKHFPNPLSERETAIGSILHQVFELSVDGTGTVSAVAWSPATPSSGGLAASLDTCIGLFSFQPEICDSSFCWSQTTVLVQSTKVDAIKWTGSGDGIVSVGIEVVLWKKYERSWEIAWKFRPEVPQMIVSATWSIEGPLATAPLHGLQVEDLGFPTCLDKNYVLVFRGDKDSQLAHAMLPHPQPVSMVQWRPSASREPNKDGRSFKRLLLLTCCLDGAVRLWSEMNDEMVKKPFKENDRKVTRLCLQVVAVAEMNQPLSGKLGYDIFVRWATDIDGVVKIGEETCLHSSLEEDQHDKFGKCEWLIAYGPEKNLSLWAAHCLDDFAPARFPRITLWNNKEINFPEVCSKGLPLSNVFITRNQFFEPPIVCSWVDLLPCNTLVWIHLYSSTPTPGEERSSKSSIEEDGLPKKSQTDILPFCARGILDVDNYSDKISQVAVLPCSFESEFAASLSINGVLQFWTLSATSCDVMPTLNSSWKFSGITIVSRSSSRYSCLNWGPAMSNEEWSLFVGHAHGVDFFIVTTSKNEEKKLLCHNMCTIPFFREDNVEGPNSVCLISLPSTDNETFVYNNFLLVSVWKSAFQALSSKISIHYYDDSGISCNCNLGKLNNVKNSSCRFKSSFCSKTYCVSVEPCSSRVPAPYNHDLVSSFEVLCPTNYVLSMDQDSSYEKCSNHFSYHLVTGCSDGSLKIWKSKLAKSLNSQWELVGLLCIHSGPILAISSSSCGRRIATISKIDKATTSSNLHIWECVHLMDQGSFILEDTLYFDSEVVALNWLTMGNGQLLLGVCTGNKLQVYGQRRCGGHYIMKSETSLEGRIWVCIAECHTKATIHDFFWGPKATIVVAHSEYFSLYSRLLFLEGSKSFSKFCEKMYGDRCVCCNGSEEPAPSSLYEGFDNHRRCQFRSPMKMNTILEIIPVINVKVSEKECNSLTNIGIWSMLELMEMLGGSIPVIHPDALLVNLLSGHWKRSHVVLNCFSEHISCETFAKRSCFQNFRCYTLPVPLSNYLEGCTLRSSADKSFQWSGGMSSSLRESYQSASNLGNYEPLTSPSRCEISSFIEAFDKLSKCTIMSDTEVMYTRAAITLLQEVSNTELVSPYESLDDPGRRFWVAMRFQLLYFVERCHRSPLVGELVSQSSLIGWAFHSGCQDTLFDSLLSTEPSWEEMRDIGIGFWFTNVTQLRSKMEKLAKQQYLKNKDPKACTLLYIALNKIQVLRGLFRISKDEKDKPLVGFLSRNFQEDKNKAAAVKNAYVLLGKHELELAVAFFLLGGDMTSAVTVCVKNLRDEQLGLLICHLVEGYGGPLEHYIVMKLLLPSAVAKGDYWLASFLEWILGNYSRSYQRMLAVPPESCLHKYVLSSHQDAFLDPSIGQYCLMLTMKTCMRNVVGEKNAAALGKWANLMCATALSRCGLPLEALECLCSSLNIFASSDLGSIARNADTEIFNVGTLEVLVNKSMSNWITGGVAFDVASNARIDLAMQYITKLLRKHPCWIDIDKRHIQAYTYTEPEYEARKRLLNMFQDELLETVLCLEQKFSVTSIDLMNMIFLSLSNKNLECIGYSLLYDYTSKYTLEEKGRFNIFFSYPPVPKRLLKVAEDVLHSLSRYVIVCGMSYFNPELSSGRGNAATTHGIGFIQPLELYKWSFICSLCCVREMMMLYSISSNHIFTRNHFIVLNLFEIFLYFSTFWAQRNLRGLTMILTPLVAACDEGIASHEINIEDLRGILFQNSESMIHDTPGIGVASLHINDEKLHKQVGDLLSSVSKEKVWQTIGLFLWGTVSIILEYQVCIVPLEPRGRKFVPQDTTQKPSSSSVHDGNSPVEMVSVLARLLKETCGHVSDYCVKQLASFMLERVSKSAYLCPEYRSPTKILDHFIENVNILSDGDELSSSKMFRSICTELWEVKGDFLQEKTQLLQYIKYKSLSGWHNVYPDIMGACEAEETCDKDVKLDSPSSAAGSPLACLSPNDHPFLNSSGKYSDLQENILPFDKPKEIYRRNGELLEALCFNSVDRCQGALSSNRKGILFFNWKDGLSCAHRSDFVWEKADWPCNGCTRYEATAISLHVSPEVVLSKKMTSPELGGATVSVGSSLRPMKVFTSRGTFGVPGYAGITSGLGWGVQQDIDECVFPPVTVENVRSRAFSTHPSRPFFLVGSSSEHIYLWEYGKDRASATYGVVPATNVPRSYALAYISSVQFDYYGHRFVTAASDGTVSTWQLEVGGKSNIHPTESSICFKNYTSDATYITTSGSIIAAAGYSSNGVNVVIWDTLAPPTTSQASIMCHEGGASSLSVFDNDIGSGSISPLIVTGGKGGDVGIHDFRYIATGRAAKKNNKHFDMSQQSVHSTVDMHYRTGDQNRNGMLWYIPKAHTASVTKICTIPNTSFFLTGSKDGDVKLWDAKRARLVFHWPKLHERHTFLQPTSHGFGGVRAGVTNMQIVSTGFVSCGGDGSVRLVSVKGGVKHAHTNNLYSTS
ncbi:unnamed protein product [Cuscuta epithymum]|uniref:RAVE complex protein Rav1 C-terminal domain-containing protein n=1 Tax=Cuscuta epithymum TaxID=186058 RepID=A0AAV0CEM0_9ASTE|nr:unnamed protein product [Cuscuta epithymum]